MFSYKCLLKNKYNELYDMIIFWIEESDTHIRLLNMTRSKIIWKEMIVSHTQMLILKEKYINKMSRLQIMKILLPKGMCQKQHTFYTSNG